MKLAIQMHPQDNVATAMEALQARERFSILSDRGAEIAQLDTSTDVPLPFHKVALAQIDRGEAVIKYGEVIGYATAPIACGAWVHLHNLQSANLPGEGHQEGER
jgi:hypothetical protein